MMRLCIAWALACFTIGCGGAGKKSAVATPEDADRPVPWAASGIDWSAIPTPGPEPAFRTPEATTFQLGNGIRVIMVTNHRLPLASVQIVLSAAGGVRDPAELKGLAALTADMLDEGAGRWSAIALANETERLGATLDAGAGVEAAYVTMDTLTSTLEPSLALLAQVVASPHLDAADFERVKGDHLSMLRRRRDRPGSVASLIFDRVIFGSHAYGMPNSGTEATVAKITSEDVARFYSQHYSPAETTVVVVGDVAPKTLRANLEETFGSWAPRTITPLAPNLALPDSSPPRLAVCNEPGAKQSAIRIGRIALRRSDSRFFDAVLLNTVVGGSYTSRLNKRLREELGYTYGVRSTFWFGRESGTWRVHTSVDANHTIDAIREILAIVERARDEEIPADELERNKQYLVRQFPQEFESNAAIADSFSDLVVHDLPLSWYAGYRKGIEGVSAASERQLAEELWPRDQLHLVVVGDLDRVLAGLLRLGFGDALEVDPEGKPLRVHPVK